MSRQPGLSAAAPSPSSHPRPRPNRHDRRRQHSSGLPNSRCEDVARDLYLPHIRLRKRSWQVDERILRQHILPTFAARQLHDISRTDVERWLAFLAAKGLAPATCNRILSVFKSLCSFAVACGLLPLSPCMGVASFQIRQLRERYLTQAEARRLLQALRASPRPEARALQLLLLTGARKSEILTARWEHVHLERHLLTVPLSKSNRPRHIVLSDEAMHIIRNLPRRPGCPWLFPGGSSSRPLADIYLFWNRLRRQLGLADVRIHDLRHTFASILVNAGHSLYEVQRLLGHRDPRTTMRYAHLEHGSLLTAADSVGLFLGRASASAPSRQQQVPLSAACRRTSRPERDVPPTPLPARKLPLSLRPCPPQRKKRLPHRRKNMRRHACPIRCYP